MVLQIVCWWRPRPLRFTVACAGVPVQGCGSSGMCAIGVCWVNQSVNQNGSR